MEQFIKYKYHKPTKVDDMLLLHLQIEEFKAYHRITLANNKKK